MSFCRLDVQHHSISLQLAGGRLPPQAFELARAALRHRLSGLTYSHQNCLECAVAAFEPRIAADLVWKEIDFRARWRTEFWCTR